jgi:hypothetical protein
MKEDEVSILDAILRKREPVATYRTIDGGHPAPYPDMTDEQLYNYEVAFNVPKRTFDRPPSSARAPKREPEYESRAQASERTFDTPPPSAGSARHEPHLQRDERLDMPEPESSAHTAKEEAQQESLESLIKPDDHLPPLDFSKPVQTITTKQPVEIITTRARHPIYKVHGYIDDDDIVTVFTLDGRLSEHGLRFLENVPEKRELHLNIYPNHDAGGKEKYIVTQHDTREEADAAATTERIACVKAEFNS